MRRTFFVFPLLAMSLLLVGRNASADGPQDNNPDKIDRVPKEGVEISKTDQQELQDGVAQLQADIDKLAKKTDVRTQSLLPDVQIFAQAVGTALKYHEFLEPDYVAKARDLLKLGKERAVQLAAGNAPWTTQQGLVVRGYVSRLDGSVQPYGIVVPSTYAAVNTDRVRLDVWLHGRDAKLTEIKYLTDRLKSAGEFTPADTIVLHPYGRFCNAFKFAGEVDVLQALRR